MNYQGVSTRRDLVWCGVVFWFLVTYYPLLSIGLVASLLVSTYWETTTSKVGVMVNMFRGKVTKGKGSDGNYRQNIALTNTTISDKEEPQNQNDLTRNIKEQV